MTKDKRSKYPHEIITDNGETVVKIVPSSMATKIHKCLFCNTETDFYEEHLLLLPMQFTGNRRYAHAECYEKWGEYSSDMIRLHPQAPNLATRRRL